MGSYYLRWQSLYATGPLAYNFSRYLGKAGSWLDGLQKISKEERAIPLFAEKMYFKTRDAIANVTPPGELRSISNKLSKLIPIQKAIINRIPIEERNALVNISEMFSLVQGISTGNPATMLFALINRGLRSPYIGAKFVKVGRIPEKISPATADAVRRAFAASGVSIERDQESRELGELLKEKIGLKQNKSKKAERVFDAKLDELEL